METLNVLLASLFLCPEANAPQEKPTEIVFIGTQHFITDMPEGYTPAHLRALLDKVQPSVLAVEAPSNVKTPWEFSPLELRWVTHPWADQHRIPIIPTGWNDPFYQTKCQVMIQALKKAGKEDQFLKLEQRFQRELSNQVSCEQFNADAGIDLWRQYHKELHEAYGKDTPWESWNSKLLENLRGVIRDFRGKRVAIVFGAAHGYFLIDALSREEGVKILPCRSFLPISSEEVSQRTTPKDHLLALRLLNFGAVAPEQLEGLGKHLELLKDAQEYRGDYELFSGKMLLHRGDAEGAAAAFRRAAALVGDPVSAMDGSSRLNEAGGIYLAIALSRQGKTEEAQGQLKSLLKKESLSGPMKQWAEQLLKEFDSKNEKR